MRIAIVSDVHGNIAALEAVIEDIGKRGVDEVVHGGDLAVMGSAPASVVERIRELGWRGVLGNTDEMLWAPDQKAAQVARAPKLERWLDRLFDEYAPRTRELLDDDSLAWLKTLPTELELADGLTLVHAAPGDLWRAPLPDADDETLVEIYGQLRPLVAYGHIHRPYVREVHGLRVVNAGSAGAPFDRDPRASYLVVDGGNPEIVRVSYDVEQEAQALVACGHPDAERLGAMRREGRFIGPG